jgi:hypothetical protein
MIKLRGPQFRTGQMLSTFEYTPPVMMQSLDVFGRPTSQWIPLCGRCFRVLGDDPFNGHPGQTRPMRIENKQRCFKCGRRCHPDG